METVGQWCISHSIIEVAALFVASVDGISLDS